MTRIRLLFAGFVGIPMVVAVALAGLAMARELPGVRLREDLRMARAGLTLLRQDLGAATERLAQRARVVREPDPELPAVQRAQEGDTVATLDASGEDIAVTIYLGVRRADGSMQIRRAQASFTPSLLQKLEGIAGYEAALYLNGVKRAATDPTFGQDTLSTSVLERLSRERDGVALETGRGVGGAASLGGPRSGLAQVVVMAAPTNAARLPFPRGFFRSLLVLVVVVVAAGFFGARSSKKQSGSRAELRSGTRASITALVPLATALSILVSSFVGFRTAIRQELDAGLARGLAIARGEGEQVPAPDIAELTGFDVFTVAPDGVERTTLRAGPDRVRVRRIAEAYQAAGGPAPVPPSERPLPFAAQVLPDGGVMVLVSPALTDPVDRVRSWFAGLAMAMTLLALVYMVLARGPSGTIARR